MKVYVVSLDFDEYWERVLATTSKEQADLIQKLLEERYESRDYPGEEIAVAREEYELVGPTVCEEALLDSLDEALKHLAGDESFVRKLCLATPYDGSDQLCAEPFGHSIDGRPTPHSFADAGGEEVRGAETPREILGERPVFPEPGIKLAPGQEEIGL
jgi:hypothetical protein